MSIWILWRTVTRHRHTKTSSLTLESHTQWAGAFVAELSRFYPPNVGVVGPQASGGNWKVLTYDAVHRSHLEIFGGHRYPAIFKNWYSDDWISKVQSARPLAPSALLPPNESLSAGIRR